MPHHAPQQNPSDALRQRLADEPGAVLEQIAQEENCCLLDVVRCLPQSHWTEVSGRHYLNVLSALPSWGEVTTVLHTADVIMEFKGPFPSGRTGHGFYNLQGKTGLSGHLRPERCQYIVFMQRPFMGMETASIQFYNAEGAGIFKIFVGRDEQRQLRPDQLQHFSRLRNTLAALDHVEQEASA
ncbi:heme utilization cystosolic carrier protein HutX [Ectothiorhodospira sp. BSL-9]|uniref:heme utilization cystosolic carrier protein HutX n=1 Tax=Ectothiorhodospira sp. BSL-9 TaxID=1442136 RepID=UPI0007B44DD2|nr:heme utilization cystosolic carrier protein HutX [Ectothiorhodospira sp. BSL-9]ANB02842.1 hypothetical protein ECTOBSL9_2344 [Ectothiorhodospira sp. BSL-9]TVQ75178.1 MAG: heme utilization cystosolic carrier protein HutX [Chromatiaceae bacterium]